MEASGHNGQVVIHKGLAVAQRLQIQGTLSKGTRGRISGSEKDGRNTQKIRKKGGKKNMKSKFAAFIEDLKAHHSLSDQDIAIMADSERSTVTYWRKMEEGQLPKTLFLNNLLRCLEENGWKTEQEILQSIINSGNRETDRWGHYSAEWLAREKKAEKMEALNRGALPAALWNDIDIHALSYHWPYGREMEFVYARATNPDQAAAYMTVYGHTSQKEALSEIMTHGYYMDQCAKYGFSEDFFQKNILYFPGDAPESAADVPEGLREQVAVGRLRYITGEKRNLQDGAGEEDIKRLLNAMESTTGGYEIEDAAEACGVEKEYWDMYENEEFMVVLFLEDRHINLPDYLIVYTLFDTSLEDGKFSIRTSDKGRELLEWLGRDSTIKETVHEFRLKKADEGYWAAEKPDMPGNMMAAGPGNAINTKELRTRHKILSKLFGRADKLKRFATKSMGSTTIVKEGRVL